MNSISQSRRFGVGKLPPEHLERLLARAPADDPRLVVGARIGEDAAVIDMGDRYLVAKTDPITFVVEKIGWYAVHINANDIAVTGADPEWFLATLLLPEDAIHTERVEEIFSDILAACRELGVTLCGGHTEITYGLKRPIVVGQMLGEVKKDKLLRKDSLRPGDRIVLTRGVAIEGTAVLAREKHTELAGMIPATILEAAQGFLFDPGISVVRVARAAAGYATAMHDPTEGGVLAGLLEMALAARLGILVSADQVTILPETREICSALGLDPLALLASGALLIGVQQAQADRLVESLGSEGIPAAAVAELLPAQDGYHLRRGGEVEELKFPERDELARLFATESEPRA